MSFPLWKVIKAEPDYFIPNREILVRVEKPIDKNNSRIKGLDHTTSEWLRMQQPFYYIKGKQFRIREISQDICDSMVRMGASVRVPNLERLHATEIRANTIKKYREFKRNR